jgi:hypothetical protein
MPRLYNLCRLLAFIGCVYPALLWAHHPGHLRDVQYTDAEFAIQFSLEHAPYDLDIGKGSWSRATLETYYKPLSWLSLTSSIPLGRLAPAGTNSHLGLGDIEFAAMGTLIKNPDSGIYLALGSGIELPTGDDHIGLGGGHIALIPRATLSWMANQNFAVIGDLLYSHTLDGHGHGHAPTALALHSKQEVRSQLTLAFMQPSYFLSAGVSLTYGLVEPKGLGPVTALAEGGLRFLESWAIVGNIEVPITDAQRFDRRAGIGVRWSLPVPEPEECGCGARIDNDGCNCRGCTTGEGCTKP